MGRMSAFGILACCTYITSSLAGQVMVEKARQESIRAKDRAILAEKMVGEINNRIDDLTGMKAVDEWAKAHNFDTVSQLAQPGGPNSTVAVASTAPTAIQGQLIGRRAAPVSEDDGDAQSR